MIVSIIAIVLSAISIAIVFFHFRTYARNQRKDKEIKTVEMLMRYNEYVTDNAQEISDALYDLLEGKDELAKDRRQFMERTEGIAVLYNRGSISKDTVNTFVRSFLQATYQDYLQPVISKIQKDDPKAYVETRKMCESMLSYQA